MPWYLIQYLDEEGRKRRVEVEGVDDVEAIKNSRIDENQILKTSKSITIGSRDLPLGIQELILSQVRALVYSGQTVNSGIEHMLSRIGTLKKKKKEIQFLLASNAVVSEILQAMGVSKASVALVRAGESSGQLKEALDSALQHAQAEKAIKEQVSSPFTQGLVIILLALGMVMGLPNMIGPALGTLIDAGLDLDTNIFTDILLFIFHYNSQIWWGLLGLVVFVAIFRKLIWLVAQDLPGFRLMKDFFILKRSVLLLMVFKPLFASGISLNKSLEIVKGSMNSASDIKAINNVVLMMESGASLSIAIHNHNDWSPMFYNSFASFEQATFEAQMQLIESVTVALLGELKNISAKIALAAGILGKVLGFFALMMMIIGYYFPSLTAST